MRNPRYNGILVLFYFSFTWVLLNAVVLDKLKLLPSKIANEVKTLENGCECIEYNCGCCQDIYTWEADRLCLNVSYLDHDYGFSLTVMFNNFTVINETVSARNPPPICVGEDIADMLKVGICVRIYDIDISSKNLHCCFETDLYIFKFKMLKVLLGCINMDSIYKLESYKNDTKALQEVPNAILV